MRIVLLAGKGSGTNFLYNALETEVQFERILLTDGVSKKRLIKRRAKKLGWLRVINQLAFQVFSKMILSQFSAKRYKQCILNFGFDDSLPPNNLVQDVGFVNSDLCLETIKNLNPDLIIVNGTSIISKKILESVDAPFINIHVGITPQYRGVHGGYWALRNNDEENFGVTVHLIDKGIDTGAIIYQNTTQSISKKDNFLTYPLHQMNLAIPLLKKAIGDSEKDNLKSYKKENVESKLYYHPTITGYLWNRLIKGVK